MQQGDSPLQTAPLVPQAATTPKRGNSIAECEIGLNFRRKCCDCTWEDFHCGGGVQFKCIARPFSCAEWGEYSVVPKDMSGSQPPYFRHALMARPYS
mmetsp:Transcript_96849/g.269354  ORF Transcript_96849/g.269354 Transcript_96849/m.269354 type:complete len:97 (+) Transcript_96849:1284-1574(+)